MVFSIPFVTLLLGKSVHRYPLGAGSLFHGAPVQLQSHTEPVSKRDAGGCCFPCSLLLSLLTPGSSPPVDTTRVALRDVDESVPGSDYINANYIKVPGEGRAARGGCLHPPAGVGCSTGVNLEGAACQEPSASPGSFSAVSPRDLTVLPSPICPHPRVDLDALLSIPAQEVPGD